MASVAEKLGAVADKIREKTGSSELMDLDEMAIAVDEIWEKGKQEVVEKLTDLEVTENGEYTPSGDSTGFKKVSVNVASSGGGNTFQVFLENRPDALESLFSDSTMDDDAFYNLLTSVDFSKVSGSAQYMFYRCVALTTVPLFNTSNVTNMYYMFGGCTALKEVPLFDTSNVTNMRNMFDSCTNLTAVPLFNTNNVTSMSYLFSRCGALTTVPLFDTSNVTSMASMFYSCTALTTVPSFDTSNVTNMRNMFYNCIALKEIPKINIDAISESGYYSMFSICSALENLTIEGTIKHNGFSVSDSSLLTHDSLMSIINALADKTTDTSTTWSVALGSTNIAKLTEEELQIAYDKGWSVK